ncbi:transporter substrate-binding domain-containing protein [Roseateles asaccharophilus]|uniref:Polar amino acid transport system substrate-binding protein n=1 Tax=Roseateles asaccharophilus TaxID=582607 RepID=A0ABU2A365_9BURK|nr:transporter substrate-binding domain-containing protein [Roseateles asaccharophilus]MDR7331631.1 polar amino acid transport system substrate-binding protein [Roseateles asaccharophilus]
MRRWLAALLLACSGVGAARADEPPALRFIVGQDWAWPYLELRDGRPVGGLAFDLMERVARAADARAAYLVLPPKRTQPALHAGEADLMCMMSPKWVAERMAPERVGPPLVVLEDVLAVLPGKAAASPLDLRAQRGLRVGTVLGYHYHELGPLFDAGQLLRDDASTQQAVLDKLARGRTQAAVVDRLVLAQYNRGRPAAEALRASQVVSQTVTHCLLGGRTQLPAARLHQALRVVAERAELARLLQRYR